MGLRGELPVCANAEHLILYILYWFIWSSRDHEAGVMAWLYLPHSEYSLQIAPLGWPRLCPASLFLFFLHPILLPLCSLPRYSSLINSSLNLLPQLCFWRTEPAIDHFNSILLTRVFHDLANNLHMNIRSKSQQFYSYKFQEETYRWQIYSSEGLDGWHKVT